MDAELFLPGDHRLIPFPHFSAQANRDPSSFGSGCCWLGLHLGLQFCSFPWWPADGACTSYFNRQGICFVLFCSFVLKRSLNASGWVLAGLSSGPLGICELCLQMRCVFVAPNSQITFCCLSSKSLLFKGFFWFCFQSPDPKYLYLILFHLWFVFFCQILTWYLMYPRYCS